MVSGLADVEYGIEIGCLSGRCQHGAYATFQSGDLGCDSIVCRVLQAGIDPLSSKSNSLAICSLVSYLNVVL